MLFKILKSTSYIFYIIFVVAACNSNAPIKNKTTENIEITKKNDSLLIYTANKIVAHLYKLEIDSLNNFTFNDNQILFAPYQYLDTSIAKSFTPNLLSMVNKSEKKVHWANYDGTGEPMDLDVKSYFLKYINDKDYLKADTIRANESVKIGNAVNNINTIFSGAQYVEYFYKGTDKNDGINWKSLKIVFNKLNDKFILVAIVHNQWTV